MKTKIKYVVVALLFAGLLAGNAYAQRGVGEATGVGQMDVKPKVESFSGEVLSIETGPCAKTTGRSALGTHFVLKTAEETELNIHLGPAATVNYIANQLPIGKEATVKAFRTEKMPENHYVAQSLTFGENSIQLRDDNLRPFWAGGNRARGNRPSGDAISSSGRGGAGFGPGNGRGYGRGRGQGYGRGQGQGSGQGYGGGRGYGGQGRGRGRGAGQCRRAL